MKLNINRLPHRSGNQIKQSEKEENISAFQLKVRENVKETVQELKSKENVEESDWLGDGW